MRAKMSPDDFAAWQKNHQVECSKNHHGSAGAMEPEGMLTIFKRSKAVHNLMYTGYLGDGDSKSYRTVSTQQPPIYGKRNTIKKLECCGHVQKRMGKRLMDKVAACKGKTFKFNKKTVKGLGGAGRLTKKVIKNLQGHYGAAIRNNPGNVAAMKKAIWATFKHRGKDHSDCGDWCPAVSSSNTVAANKNCLPSFVLEAIKPIYEQLSSDELLEKCAHGGTQNSNESFHHLIWERCPKTKFVGRKRLEIAVMDAALVFNEGESKRNIIFDHLGLKVGNHAAAAFQRFDSRRLYQAVRADTPASKEKRKKKSLEKTYEQENLYEA